MSLKIELASEPLHIVKGAHPRWMCATCSRGKQEFCVVLDSPSQSTIDAVHVYEVPWSEFPIVPSYPHYPRLLFEGRPPSLDVCHLFSSKGGVQYAQA